MTINFHFFEYLKVTIECWTENAIAIYDLYAVIGGLKQAAG